MPKRPITEPINPQYTDTSEPSGFLPDFWFELDNTDLEGPAAGHWIITLEGLPEQVTEDEVIESFFEDFNILEVKRDSIEVLVEEFEKILKLMPSKSLEDSLQEAALSALKSEESIHRVQSLLPRTSSYAAGDVEEIANQFKERYENNPEQDLELFTQNWAADLNLGPEEAGNLYNDVASKLRGLGIVASQDEIKRLKKIVKGLSNKKVATVEETRERLKSVLGLLQNDDLLGLLFSVEVNLSDLFSTGELADYPAEASAEDKFYEASTHLKQAIQSFNELTQILTPSQA